MVGRIESTVGLLTDVLPSAQVEAWQEVVPHDTITVPMERPKGLRDNQLGLMFIDLHELHPLHALIVEKGQRVEEDRGNEGFNPNAIAYIWTPQGLSLDGVANIIHNYHIWKG